MCTALKRNAKRTECPEKPPGLKGHGCTSTGRAGHKPQPELAALRKCCATDSNTPSTAVHRARRSSQKPKNKSGTMYRKTKLELNNRVSIII